MIMIKYKAMSDGAKTESVSVINKINEFRRDELAQRQRSLSKEPGATKFALRVQPLDGGRAEHQFGQRLSPRWFV